VPPSDDPPPGVLVAVTEHAAERFRQRVGGRLGLVDVRDEVRSRAAHAWAVIFVCRHDPRAQELVVITLWEEERLGPARVPRRFTDALDPHRR
jgi:hypothetical protein